VVGELGEINISIGGPSKRISSQGEDISTLIVPQFIPRNPRFRLSDVILPAQTQIQISEALAKVVHHDTIYRKWGFERVDPVGRGVVLNFIGPPGTGKTRCAEAFAGELGLSFLQVSLDEIESRFMGETPKNIRSAFESARKSGAVLFFDEADTVLGKRLSAVTQGADHEINLERATMLMELDVHEGIVIFASNFPQNYDPAFRRRIAHHIEFYLPDEDARRRLWEYHLVPGIPLAEDRNELIRKAVALTEGLSGGDILTCLRLALPSCLLEGGDNAKLGIKHIEAAVDRIKVARSRIGRDDGDEGTSRHQALRSLFGIPAPPAEGLGGKAQDEK
jgi:SpoVK/Ycf46/Vps4 family AAA+-type ATPase